MDDRAEEGEKRGRGPYALYIIGIDGLGGDQRGEKEQ